MRYKKQRPKCVNKTLHGVSKVDQSKLWNNEKGGRQVGVGFLPSISWQRSSVVQKGDNFWFPII